MTKYKDFFNKNRTLMTAFIILFSLASFAMTSCSGQKQSSSEIIEEMVVYYGKYGDDSDERVQKLLKEMKAIDNEAYEKWSSVMELWKRVGTDLNINYGTLPDGLLTTDELCIVALGFQLMPDGTMKEELVERLGVLKKSAEKYPNALIVCTGGGTASDDPDATEAGEMTKWLIENGIDSSRIITEDKSLTTAQNAMYTCEILNDKYPDVRQIAIISSDYHIATGMLLFGTECILRSDKKAEDRMEIVSNAAWDAPFGSLSRMFQAGALIELTGDKETAYEIYYGTYDIKKLPPLK